MLAYDIEIEDDSDHVLLKTKIKDEKTKKTLGEYDIIAVNHKELVVVEVKNKVIPDHITHFIEVQLPKFKTLLPEYKNYKVYGGI